MQDVILPRHPPEPHAQRHKPRVLRTEAQRLAVLLAVVEQVPLIALEHGPRDFDGLGRCRAPCTSARKKPDVTCAASSPCTRSSSAPQARWRCSRISASSGVAGTASGLRCLRHAGHDLPPSARYAVTTGGSTTPRMTLLFPVFFSAIFVNRFWSRMDTGDWRTRTTPGHPPTWARLDPDFSALQPRLLFVVTTAAELLDVDQAGQRRACRRRPGARRPARRRSSGRARRDAPAGTPARPAGPDGASAA